MVAGHHICVRRSIVGTGRDSPGRENPLGGLKWWVLHMKPESTGEGGVLFEGGVLLGAGGYCFGTQTQSAKVQIPRPYRPLRKSPQKSPGGAKMAGLANKTREHPSIMTQDVLLFGPAAPVYTMVG